MNCEQICEFERGNTSPRDPHFVTVATAKNGSRKTGKLIRFVRIWFKDSSFLKIKPAAIAMSDIPSLRAADAIHNVKKRLLGKKLRLEVIDDFKAFKKVCKKLEGKNHTQWTDWQYTDLTDGFSYWLKVTDLSGKIIAVCVTRTIELTRGASLLEYLKAHFERIHLDTPKAMPKIGGANHEFLSSITGRFCYFGDLYIDQSLRRASDTKFGKFAGDLAKLQLLMAYLDYNPDYIFCFVKLPLIDDGFAARCGFWHHIEKPLDFSRPPRFWKGDECFCWMAITVTVYILLKLHCT